MEEETKKLKELKRLVKEARETLEDEIEEIGDNNRKLFQKELEDYISAFEKRSIRSIARNEQIYTQELESFLDDMTRRIRFIREEEIIERLTEAYQKLK